MSPDEYGLPPAVVRMHERRRKQLALARAAAAREWQAAVAAENARGQEEHARWLREEGLRVWRDAMTPASPTIAGRVLS